VIRSERSQSKDLRLFLALLLLGAEGLDE